MDLKSVGDLFNNDNPLNKGFKKGDKHELIKKIQFTINTLAGFRSMKTIEDVGKEYKLPIEINGSIDAATYAACIHFFPKFKSNGLISVNESREKWAYSAGYYDLPFPPALAQAEEVSVYKKHYVGGAQNKLDSSIKIQADKVLNEILIAYEALGAESIKIHELKHIDASLNGGAHGVDVGVNASHEKQVLIEKRFGRGVFDPERALKNAKHIIELPNVMRIIEGRIHGNQTYEKFEETVSFGAGLSVKSSVKNAAMSAGASFNSKQTWLFEIQFYDKN